MVEGPDVEEAVLVRCVLDVAHHVAPLLLPPEHAKVDAHGLDVGGEGADDLVHVHEGEPRVAQSKDQLLSNGAFANQF